MRISLQNWENACRLQGETPVADLHLDLPGELLFRHSRGELHVIARRYLPAWAEAGIRLIGASVFVEDCCLPGSGLRNALLQIAALWRELGELEGKVHLIRNRNDLDRAYRGCSVGILLYLEGLDFLGADAELLTLCSELGVAGASLTWSRCNLLASGCCRASEQRAVRGGLTREGVRVLDKMKELRMFLDISHLNDEGIETVLTEADIPILATHSNARGVYFHYRNLTDGQIALLADRGGLIGLNACDLLTGACWGGGRLEQMRRQALYLCRQAGEDHVCLGLDLCHRYELARRELEDDYGQGDDGLSGHGELPLLTAALLEGGMESVQVRKLLGENAFAFFRRILPM